MVSPLSAPAWGTVPDWVGAAATALTLIGFSVALIREIRQRRRDERRAADERRDNEANQARLVFTTAPMGGTPTQIRTSIRNASAAPIFDMGLEALRNEEGAWRVVATRDPQNRAMTELEPGGELQRWMNFLDGESPMSDGEEFQLRLTFTDAEGRRWRRIESGQPERVVG